MDVERALRESLAANDLTLWSASGACVVNVDEATRNLAASLVARGVAPSPDAPGPLHEYQPGGTFALHETTRQIVYVDHDEQGRRRTTFVAEAYSNALDHARALAPSPDAPGPWDQLRAEVEATDRWYDDRVTSAWVGYGPSFGWYGGAAYDGEQMAEVIAEGATPEEAALDVVAQLRSYRAEIDRQRAEDEAEDAALASESHPTKEPTE